MRQVKNHTTRLLMLALILSGIAIHTPAFALTLDEARTQGLVGERPDGLIAAVPSTASTDIAALVAEINKARLDSYKQLAAKDGVPVEAVQAIAGEKLMGRARTSGWYVMNSAGQWSR